MRGLTNRKETIRVPSPGEVYVSGVGTLLRLVKYKGNHKWATQELFGGHFGTCP